MELVLYDTSMILVLYDTCVLEPLAVLSLLLGGQKVSLGFFSIIIFGEGSEVALTACVREVTCVITRSVEKISLWKVVMKRSS